MMLSSPERTCEGHAAWGTSGKAGAAGICVGARDTRGLGRRLCPAALQEIFRVGAPSSITCAKARHLYTSQDTRCNPGRFEHIKLLCVVCAEHGALSRSSSPIWSPAARMLLRVATSRVIGTTAAVALDGPICPCSIIHPVKKKYVRFNLRAFR